MEKPPDYPSHIRVHRPKMTGEHILEYDDFACVYVRKGMIFVGHQHSIARVGGDLRYAVDDQSEAAKKWLAGTIEGLKGSLQYVVTADEAEAAKKAAL